MRAGTLAALVLALLLAGCKSGRNLPFLERELPARSAEKLLERLLAHEQDTLRYYSARGNVSVKTGGSNRSFKAHFRVVRDSAAWVSVVPLLGIEAARVVITPDSLKVLDKLADQYFLGDSAAAKAKFGLMPSLAMLQDALLGRAIGLDPSEKFRSDREDGQYVLTSREKRRFVRAAEDRDPADTLDSRNLGERRLERTLDRAREQDAVVVRYWLHPDDFRVTRIQISDLAREQHATIRYVQRGGPEEGHLPTSIEIAISEPGRTASGSMELSRIAREGPLEMNFRIPDKFTPMP
ncbi:MAG: DUF4292 domain-containing protein [Flavobacteriales bacterium]|nr:DUF4292 domain-containing protein [Flavobacteriales bacterium]